jgi:hypothetical protein
MPKNTKGKKKKYLGGDPHVVRRKKTKNALSTIITYSDGFQEEIAGVPDRESDASIMKLSEKERRRIKKLVSKKDRNISTYMHGGDDIIEQDAYRRRNRYKNDARGLGKDDKEYEEIAKILLNEMTSQKQSRSFEDNSRRGQLKHEQSAFKGIMKWVMGEITIQEMVYNVQMAKQQWVSLRNLRYQGHMVIHDEDESPAKHKRRKKIIEEDSDDDVVYNSDDEEPIQVDDSDDDDAVIQLPYVTPLVKVNREHDYKDLDLMGDDEQDDYLSDFIDDDEDEEQEATQRELETVISGFKRKRKVDVSDLSLVNDKLKMVENNIRYEIRVFFNTQEPNINIPALQVEKRSYLLFYNQKQRIVDKQRQLEEQWKAKKREIQKLEENRLRLEAKIIADISRKKQEQERQRQIAAGEPVDFLERLMWQSKKEHMY